MKYNKRMLTYFPIYWEKFLVRHIVSARLMENLLLAFTILAQKVGFQLLMLLLVQNII